MFYTLNQHCLKPGDIVDIVAPSAKCHPSVLEKIRELLNMWQSQCHIPDDIFGDSLLYANSDEKRFMQLQNALLNNQSKAVWCLLGGFGATKLIPMLNNIPSPNQGKIFIGFSDITALHIFLQEKWGWPTIHGPSGYQASLNKISNESIKLLKDILFGLTKTLKYQHLLPLNKLAEINKIIDAPLVGGNLHLIQASLGTSWQMNTVNKIVFIEEIGERAYRIDRALAHLNQAGLFDKAKAILFGDMIDKGEPDGRFLVCETIQAFAAHCHLPVLQIKNVGHGPMNHPVLLGSSAKLTMGGDYSLEFSITPS